MNMKDTKARTTKNTKPGVERSIEIACKRLSWTAMKVLEKALKDENLDMKLRLIAAKEVFDRGWGKAKQSVEATINVGGGEALLEAIAHARKRTAEAEAIPAPTPEQIEKDITTITH